jgi:hypothetical protein
MPKPQALKKKYHSWKEKKQSKNNQTKQIEDWQ